MTNSEIRIFIKEMGKLGDVWEVADVKRVYGDRSLEDALQDRMGDMQAFVDIIDTVLNR